MAYNLTVRILAVVATFELMLCESVPTDQFNDMTSLTPTLTARCGWAGEVMDWRGVSAHSAGQKTRTPNVFFKCIPTCALKKPQTTERKIMSTNEKLIAAANHLVDDLNMLMDGSWEPDADSCQASIDNAVLLADGLPVLIERLRLAEEAAQQLDKAAMILADESDYMLNRVDTVLREVGYWPADDDTN